ncbi:MAG: ABC transporter ATP-binding protein [Actinomycetota bacterium]
MSQYALRSRDLGLRFWLKGTRDSTVHSRIAHFIQRKPPMEEHWALRHVNFDVGQGEVFGVIGSNGSGKSTLLRVLARIYHPDEGELLIRGKVSSLITLGAGFQGQLTGRENIHYNGLLLGLTHEQIAQRLDSMIEFAELGKFIDQSVRTYSSGMRARLGFSVAVHVDPEILVVDEVLVVGDARFRQRCADKMRELFQRGTTVVMVQHNMDAILQMCHRCMWLDKGSQRMIGKPEDVVRAYLESNGQKMPASANVANAVSGSDASSSTGDGSGGV